jgi:exonuclease III
MENTPSNITPINIGTLNIRAISTPQKIFSVQQAVIKQDLDVLLLQETHVAKITTAREIEGKLHSKALWSFGTPTSRGTGILIFNKDHIIHKFHLDLDGRLVYIDLTIEGFKFRIISVYVPTEESERRVFLNELYPFLTCQLPIIMGGDFNCIMNAKLDKIGGNPSRGLVGSKEIISFCSSFSVVDVFRINHPHLVATTWHQRGNGGVSCRIDRFYVSKTISNLYKSQYTYPFGASDHDLVVLSISNNFKNETGPGYWKLNTSILSDKDFREKFLIFWQLIISGAIITQQWWDSFKKKFSYFVQDYCVQKTKAKREAKRALQKEYIEFVERKETLLVIFRNKLLI